MKITFLLPAANLAGGTRVAVMFADHLIRRGHEVTMVSSVPPRPTWRARAKARLLGQRLPPWPPPQGPSHLDSSSVTHLAFRHRPLTDADVPDADVVIATWWETAEWAARLSPSKGARAYFIQQFEANFGQPEDRVAATWRLPFKKIVCSKWLADLARDRFGDPDADVVPNGIDLGLFHAPPRGRRPRPSVGFLYGENPVKGFDVAWEAFSTVRRRLPDLEIHAISVSAPPPELVGDPAIHFHRTPPQESLREIYARCDAWLVSSHSEGFHLPPHEAMACRCPVVSTRVGGPMDMIEEGVNGFLVEPGDSSGLADRLLRVLKSSPEDWLRMSEAALSTARCYTWEQAVVPFELALVRAVQGDGGGSTKGIVDPFRSSSTLGTAAASNDISTRCPR